MSRNQYGLTPRQTEILRLMPKHTNKEIARILRISIYTVKNIKTQLYAATETQDRLQAVMWAFRKGVIE